MTARELHANLGRMLEDRLIDADADVLVGTKTHLMKLTYIQAESVKDASKKLLMIPARLAFGRMA